MIVSSLRQMLSGSRRAGGPHPAQKPPKPTRKAPADKALAGPGYSSGQTPRAVRGGASLVSGAVRDRVDLDVHARAGRCRLDRGARRLHPLEILPEDLVEGGEVVHAPEIDADADDVGDGGATGLEHRPHVVERDARLLADVAGDDGLGDGVQ